MLLQAAEVVLEQKDLNSLFFILSRCDSSDKNLQDKINLMIISLGGKK